MRKGQGRLGLAVAAAMLTAGCGYRFPWGEKLLPEAYGPPFGAGLKENLPEHPHNPAADERHAAPYQAQSRRFRNHAACHAALTAEIARHGDSGRVQRLSAIETLGFYEAGGVVHEHRCSDYVLSYRAWCKAGGEGRGHGETHKRAEPECGGGEAH